jgi:hypothetical protein
MAATDHEVLRHRGRVVTTGDVQFIRELIAHECGASRRELSRKLCEAWDWRQANGALRDMVCRGLMLALHREGHIELPPVQKRPPNPFLVRAKPQPVELDQTSIAGTLAELGPLDVRQVRRTEDEQLCNGMLETHHYLGYVQPVGEHLKYVVYAQQRPLACFTWQSAPRHLGPRDRYIGWSLPARKQHLHLLAYNSRFLIVPWVRVPHLASHLLGRMARRLPTDWEQVYGHPVHYLETFVDPDRNRGTCYLAANWVDLGLTTGRGKDAPTWTPNRSLKKVLGLPLTRDFRARLMSVDAQQQSAACQ